MKSTFEKGCKNFTICSTNSLFQVDLSSLFYHYGAPSLRKKEEDIMSFSEILKTLLGKLCVKCKEATANAFMTPLLKTRNQHNNTGDSQEFLSLFNIYKNHEL